MLHVVSMCGLRGDYVVGKVMAWTFFFVCFFFFKAGYFSKGETKPWLWYLKDRGKRLLLPYLMWGLIGSVVYFGFLYGSPDIFARSIKALRWHHVWRMSHFYGNPPVWFLFSFCMVYLAQNLTNRLHWAVRLVICLLCPFASYWLYKQHNPLWLSLDNLPMGIMFFCLGQGWRWVKERLPRRWFLAVSILFLAVFIVNNHFHHGEYDMSLNAWDADAVGAAVNLVCAMLGISGLLLAWRMPRVPVLCFIGEHSMVFFVVHWPLMQFYKNVRIVFHHTVSRHWDDVILMAIIIFCICTWLVPRIEKNRWLSGRFPKKSVTLHS